jgi:hypothetical protein
MIHKIEKENFKDYSVSSIMASEIGDKGVKRLIVCVDHLDTTPDIYFEIFNKHVSIYKTYNLDEAIEYYNSI